MATPPAAPRPARRRIVVIAAILAILAIAMVLALLAAAWIAAGPPTADPAPALDRRPDAAADARPAIPAPLSPPDVPLRDALRGLQQRAQRGDAVALCQLYTEYGYCDLQRSQAASQRAVIVRQQQRLARAASPQARAEIEGIIASLQDALEHDPDAEYCRDVPIPDANERLRDLRRAALSGNVPAMGLYARGRGFTQTLRQLDAIQTYAGEAERIAVDAARRGDVETLFELADAYDPDVEDTRRSWLGDAVRQDARTALGYYLQLQALFPDPARPEAREPRRDIDRHIADLRARVPADAQAAAQRDAIQRQAEWSPPSPASLARLARFPAMPGADADRLFCGAEADASARAAR